MKRPDIMDVIVTPTTIAIVEPYLEDDKIRALVQSAEDPSDEIVFKTGQAAIAGVVDMLECTRAKLDFDLRQEQVPAPFDSFSLALRFVNRIDRALERYLEALS